jgi:CHAT domain-containing protein/tetratricopeptide (TPR) repeat protein
VVFLLRTKSWAGLGLLSLWAAVCACTSPFIETESREIELVPGKSVPGVLRAGEVHEARITLAAGQVLDAQVEQNGVDVSLVLEGPARKPLFKVDSPTGPYGFERLFTIAAESGVYRLRVEWGGEAPSGDRSYELLVAEPRPAEPRDQTFAQAFDELAQGENLRRQKPPQPLQALVHYRNAFHLWRGQNAQQGTTLLRIARMYLVLEDERAALGAYHRALPLTQDVGEIVLIWNSLGGGLREKDPEAAVAAHRVALFLSNWTPDPVHKASALDGIAQAYRDQGESDLASRFFERSIEEWSQAGAHSDAAMTYCRLAEHHLNLGDTKKARRVLQEMGIPREQESPERPACHDRLLGLAFMQSGSHAIAARLLETTWQRVRDSDRGTEVSVLTDLGSALLNLGRLGQAKEAFKEALAIAREEKLGKHEAYALAGLGGVLHQQGDAAAFDFYTESENLYGRLGDSLSQSTVLFRRAQAERDFDRLEAARESIDHALKLVEALRADLQSLEYRAAFLGVRTDFYDLRVDILLRLHERSPDHGYAAAAFEASEWSQSRSLLEGAQELGAGVPKSIPRDRLRRQQVLRSELQRLENERLQIVSQGAGANERGRLAGVERRISETVAEWEELVQEIRGLNPGYAALTAPRILNVSEVRQLLDPDTALIAYALGEERSVLWWIDQQGMELRQLPGREDLEKSAIEAMTLISKEPSRLTSNDPAQSVLKDLGEALLGPVSDLLPRVRRLAIVSDDALRPITFSALTIPGKDDEPLLESHEVVLLPSASLIAVLRDRQARRAVPRKAIVAFTDPVFGPSDERAGGKPPLRGELPRLLHSGDEATKILGLVSAEDGRGYVGFDATREAVLAEDFSQFQSVHFATHGLVDARDPNLSGIQLSRIDRQGRLQDGGGLLRFYEVYNLDLPVELVSLGACRSAVGPQVPGEGPIGMSRSFLYAGATRVVGALWNVDDEASAALMGRFYEVLQKEGGSPATALREAQRYVREQLDDKGRKKWQSPYYWAGFVLQGDWR